MKDMIIAVMKQLLSKRNDYPEKNQVSTRTEPMTFALPVECYWEFFSRLIVREHFSAIPFFFCFINGALYRQCGYSFLQLVCVV